jgi:DNA topoisomerase-2
MQNEIRMSNMHLHDVNGRLRLYENVYEIVREFGVFRMDLYEKRRLFMIKQIEDVLVMLVNKLRFVQEVVDEKLSVFRLHDDAALDSLLDSKGYARLPDFSYLINMPLRALTMTRVARLSAEMDDLKAQVGKLRLQSNTDLWLSDLDELECELACFSGRKQARYATENSTTKTKVRGTTSTISVKTGRQGAEGFKRSKQRGC